MEGNGCVIEMDLGLGKLIEFVNGPPRILEFIANLKEKFMGKVKGCFTEAVVYFLVG